jgi:pimeloyl-ACP methyl ester carboxylesterase
MTINGRAVLLSAALGTAALVVGDRSAAAWAGTAASVKSPDGLTIQYEAAGSGEPALVFVHGWSCDRTYWRPQIEHFSKSRRVVTLDLGGHGASSLGRKDWTMEAFAGDVRAVVEGLGLKRVVLVGHSMGGPVSLEAARMMPDRVAAVVGVDTLANVERPFTGEQREGFIKQLRDGFQQATDGFVRGMMFTPRSDPKLVDRIAKDMASGPAEVGVSAMDNLTRYDEKGALAAATVPIRLINADLFPTNLEAARRHQPKLSLAVVPGVGHFLMAEDPEEFNRLLERAIRELTRP